MKSFLRHLFTAAIVTSALFSTRSDAVAGPSSSFKGETGAVETGASENCVCHAWGKPSRKTVHGNREYWTYTQTQYGYGGGYFGLPRGLYDSKQGGRGYDRNDYYPAPSDPDQGEPETEVPMKRVTFQAGRVIKVEIASHSAVAAADDEEKNYY